MSIRKRLAAVTALAALVAGAVAVVLPFEPASAAPPAPVILNGGSQNSGNAQWAETQALADDGEESTFFATFLVQHAAGRTITSVRMDGNFDGTDNTGSVGNTAVSAQTFVAAAGGIETSRVTVGIDLGKPGGFSCPFIGGATRSVDAPVRMAVVDSTGEKSATVATTVKFVEDSNCSARADFPRLTGASQNLTEVVPGQDITYTFSCDDVDSDVFSSDDDCDRANIRWRRLDDGDTSSITLKTGINDNTNTTHTMDFPSQGFYVVEAQLGNEDGSFPNLGGASGGWWRLGNAVVNDAASSLTGSLAFAGAQASSPPSVNPGTAVTANATVADAGGAVQVIEWDADGNSAFERREYTVPANSGGNIVHSALSSAELAQSVSTATPGLKTVNARITDNGALDAADNIRRQLTFSGQLRVNALPTAANVGHTVAEDSGAATINLSGSDPDSQPAPLEYSLVAGLSNPSLGTLGSLNTSTGAITFTPAANANGSATFTYRVRDGNASTVGANGFSNTATVSITVTAVNDIPVLDAKTITTPEDTPGSVLMTGTDVEDGSNLTYTVDSQPPVGTGSASCSATTDICTYTPPLNFNGSTSFVVRGADTQGGSSTTTVGVTVTAVNDAPVANSQTVTVQEDDTNFAISLSGSDVDDLLLNFTAPIDDVDNGTLSCLGQSCTYTPTPDFNGSDSFTFKVDDGDLDSNIATVTINVVSVNDAPIATDVPDAVADEDVPEAIPATGTDVDGDPVTVDSATDPANGSTAITGANEVTYTGDLNFHGIDTYDFTVVDGNGGSDTGTVTVTVNPVNDAPVIEPQAFTIDEDTPTLLSIVAGDVDGDLLTWSVTGAASNGNVFGTGPDLVYVPQTNWSGTDTFTVQVSDGALTASATITVNVSPVNDQPVADAGAVTTAEDNGVGILLSGSDIDGDAITFLVGTTPTNGAVTCDTGGSCTYTPAPNFHGSDLFTFVVDDGAATDEASISVTVTSVNDDPVALPASATTNEDESVGIPLVATDVDGDALTFTYGSASNGVVSGSGPDAVYTPNPNVNGSDSFGFTVEDGQGGTDSAVVSVEVLSVNDAPVGTGGTVATPEDTDVSFSLGATDVEGDTLTFVVTTPPESGDLVCDAAGDCTYDPAPDFSGSVTVGYEVSDGSAQGSGVVTILVDPVNDPPVPTGPGSITTAEDNPLDFSLAATDTEGDPLTFSVVSGPTSGTLVCSTDGSCAYTPALNANGLDSFTWSVSDGTAAVTSGTSIDVVPVNDAPQALDVSAETLEDMSVTFTLLATDAEGDPIAFAVETPPGAGAVSISGNQATYTPSADYSGTDLFTYRASDPSGAFTVARASLVVNEAPLLATQLVAEAVVARVVLGGSAPLQVVAFDSMRATLTTTVGVPVVGRTITFRIGNQVICSAVTDVQGKGTCGGNLIGVQALLNLGYQVSFAGDFDFSASSARGPLIQVLSLKL